MGFYFRKSSKLGPFRLNFSKSGLGASIGVKGARLTTTPRGTTYITFGSHGFFYREVISRSTGTASTSSARTPTGPLGLSQADEIHSADVSESAESSSEKLIQDLNARASIFDPSWIFYLFALAIAAVGSVLSIPAPLPLPPLPDVTKPLSTERKGNLNDEYATLLARYGEPTSILFKDQAGVPVRVIQYQPAGTAIALVPNGNKSSLLRPRRLEPIRV
jgi:hypothetical protein